MEIKTGNYYLVARDLDKDEIFRIPIDKKTYIPDSDSEKIYGNDIAVIDYVTSKFKSKEELIRELCPKDYINSKNIDLYITHTHKYNQNNYIKEYEVIINSNDRVKSLIDLASLKINNNDIELNNPIVDDILNKFISKCFSNPSFYELMTSEWSKIDKYVISKIVEYRKKPKIDWSIKYHLNDKKTSYLVIRNIISMWNIYDELFKKVENVPVEARSRQIIKEYANKLNENNMSTKEKNNLRVKLDKNYIEGQIDIDQYLESISNQSSLEEYTLEQLYELSDIIKKQPFDSIELQKLEEMYGRFEVCNHLNVDIITSLTPKDKLILGIIDIVEYRNKMLNNNSKKSRKH